MMHPFQSLAIIALITNCLTMFPLYRMHYTFALGPQQPTTTPTAGDPALGRIAAALEGLVPKQDKRKTIVISRVSPDEVDDLRRVLDVELSGAAWDSIPTTAIDGIEVFVWLAGKEDCKENRIAYMAYLMKLLVTLKILPPNCALVDANFHKKLLDTELTGVLIQKIHGTSDVVITDKYNAGNMVTIRSNIKVLFELKKQINGNDLVNEASQTICQHIAASSLNRKHAVVSVLTDLSQNWIFFWWARDGDERSLRMKSLEGPLATAQALLLLKSLFSAVGVDLPDTFAERKSFDECFSRQRGRTDSGLEGLNDGDSDGDSDGDTKPSGSDQPPKKKTKPSVSSRGGGTEIKNNQGAAGGSEGAPRTLASVLSLFAPPGSTDVANELEQLDFVDVNEKYEIVRSFASKFMVPRMTGVSFVDES